MSLGDLQNLTMLAVARLGPRAVSREVRDLLARSVGRDVSVPTVFVTLTRLENQGLVESTAGEAPRRGGRQMRVFSITDAGWEALRDTRKASEQLWEGLKTP